MEKIFYRETDKIFRLRVPFENLYTSVFLIDIGSTKVLVDTATYPSDVDSYILPALERMGYTLSDISSLVLTHKHSDHAGGLSRILSLAPHLEVITDTREFSEVLCTYPMAGHTKDSIGVLDTRTGTLISGDGLQGAGVDKYRCYTQDREAYIETIKRIENDETIISILFSHAYEPWNKDSVFGREEVCNCLIKCIECIGDKNESNTCK